MSIKVRKVELDTAVAAIASSMNAWRRTEAVKGSYVHADVTSTANGTALTVASADGTDLATTITLANEIKLKYNVHCADTLAHKVADSTNTVSTADATDLTTLEALLNAVKTAFNAHSASTTYHYTAGATVATANATDLATSEALANAIKAAFNTHIASAPGGSSIELVSA